jgi:hypothetical protein
MKKQDTIESIKWPMQQQTHDRKPPIDNVIDTTMEDLII